MVEGLHLFEGGAMMTSFLGICTIVCLTTIDNALLAGCIIPQMDPRQKRSVITVVGILLAAAQIVSAASVDYLMKSIAFHIIAIFTLAYMAVRTLTVDPVRSTRAFPATLRLFVLTFIGNLDNIVWLGSKLQGDRVFLFLSSFAAIPIFIFISLFLAKQTEKQRWILPLGAGMMAWAAASLTLALPSVKDMIQSLDAAPFTTFQCLVTTIILVIGLCAKKLLTRRTRI